MKVAANKTTQTIVLLGGKLRLYPQGDIAGRDRFPLQERWLADEALQRFVKLGKIAIEDISARTPPYEVQKTEASAASTATEPPSSVAREENNTSVISAEENNENAPTEENIPTEENTGQKLENALKEPERRGRKRRN